MNLFKKISSVIFKGGQTKLVYQMTSVISGLIKDGLLFISSGNSIDDIVDNYNNAEGGH